MSRGTGCLTVQWPLLMLVMVLPRRLTEYARLVSVAQGTANQHLNTNALLHVKSTCIKVRQAVPYFDASP